MYFPESYYNEYTNSYCEKIGQDTRGIIKYNFNNCGFINNLNYNIEEENAICFFGSAITSCIGLPWESSFAYKLSQQLKSKKYKAYNFSQGCMFVDNAEIVKTVELTKNIKNFKPIAYVIQFIGLDRRFNIKYKNGTLNINQEDNLKLFLELFKKLEKILKNDQWIFFGCDGSESDIPVDIKEHKNCLIWNPPLIDKLLRDVPGPKFHEMISFGLKNKFKTLYNIE